MIQPGSQTKRILYIISTASLFVVSFAVLLWIYQSADGIFQFALFALLFLATCLFIYQRLLIVFRDSTVMRSLQAVSSFFNSSDRAFDRSEQVLDTADHAIDLLDYLVAQSDTSQALSSLSRQIADMRDELREQVERSRNENAYLRSAYSSVQEEIAKLGLISKANEGKQYAELQRSFGQLRDELKEIRSRIPHDQVTRLDELSQQLDSVRQEMEKAKSSSLEQQNRKFTDISSSLRDLERHLQQIQAGSQTENGNGPQLPEMPGPNARLEDWFWYKYQMDCRGAILFTHAQMAGKLARSPGDIRNRYSDWRQINRLPDPDQVRKHKVKMPDKPSDNI